MTKSLTENISRRVFVSLLQFYGPPYITFRYSQSLLWQV